jgi:hypothetical protein
MTQTRLSRECSIDTKTPLSPYTTPGEIGNAFRQRPWCEPQITMAEALKVRARIMRGRLREFAFELPKVSLVAASRAPPGDQ